MPKMMNTAELLETKACVECGWPIIFVCCNYEFKNFKDAGNWDWWYYCSNKGCKNHDGEGLFQTEPDWVKTA